MKKIFFVLLVLFISNIATGQLTVDNTTLTPQQLVQNVLLGQGINISNIKFNRSVSNSISDQIAKFDNGSTTNIGINKGIILSTGNAIIAKGPNDQGQATLPTSNPIQGDADLSLLTNNLPIRNVSVLEFDFTPVGNKVSFNFVFASDEYPEFVNDLYNDNFGFFISGPGITGPYSGNAKNIALIPGTNLPVSINNLNNGKSNTGPCEYCQYYVDNTGGSTIQYGGFTKVIQASSDVECGQTYHIKMAIANVDDNNYDSAVFIEGASFSSSGINLGEDLRVCLTNTYTLKTGLDSSVIHEWTFNGAVIPAETGPEITVSQSGNYGVKATPAGIGCPVSDDINLNFNPVSTPYLYCGAKTANSITFDWLALGYAEFSVSYQIDNDTPVNVGYLGKVYSYTVQNVPHSKTVTITVTPVGGTPAECFGPNSISCVLDTCIDTPTLTLNQGSLSQQICENSPISDLVFTIAGGATSASITSGNLPNGVTTSLVGNQFTIKGITTNTGIYNYTISTSGGCGVSATLNGSISINKKADPVFTAINAVCEGNNITSLPQISNNGITGTWFPALNNNLTTEYTFTPDSDQCANPTKLTILVNQKTTPTFNILSSICEGEIIVLPSKSVNGINGTWNPQINNLATTEYTFTPNSGECANSTKLTIAVVQKENPIFSSIGPFCEGEITNPLPLQSNNGITGTFSPAFNNKETTEYTFTPNAGQCANTTKLTIDIQKKTTPVFSLIAPICIDENLAPLPTQSTNGISGVWSPPINNKATTVYIFTPNDTQCATITNTTIQVNQKPEPRLQDGKICIENGTNKVIQSYFLDAKLNNSLYDFEWFFEGNQILNESNNILEAKAAGKYAVIAIDKITNCISDIIEVNVTETKTDSAIITLDQTNSFSENAIITITVTNSNGFFEYQLDDQNFQTLNQFSSVNSGKHIIHVRETNGCINISKEIIVIGYPKFFTPNGDGHNDTWNITGFESIENDKIFIFDRYGKLLKQFNSKTSGWDGFYNGQQMPSSDYWFKVLFTENQVEKEFRSHFSLKR